VFGKPRMPGRWTGIVDEGNSSMVVTNIFQPLMTFKPGSSELVPCLAAAPPIISKDNKEITFKLRRGVKFHDGTTMDADAVVFSLKRQHDKNDPFFKFGPWNYWGGKGWSDTEKKQGIVKDIVKVGRLDREDPAQSAGPVDHVQFRAVFHRTSCPRPREEIRRRVQEPPGRHRPLPVRGMGQGRSYRAQAVRRLLG